jgi:deoxyhypusine synthase
MAHGAHIMLDCTGAVGIDGTWMLALMEKAVDASGARRVHSHNEAFDGSVSPLGFAAVVLLDESHVSAHCYSESGWLAIDAFTCGGTDPARIIEMIEIELRTNYPDMNINRRKRVERFLTEPVNGGVRGFVDRHFTHFNAGALRDCARSLDQFLRDGGRLMVTLAGAMSTAEIGRSLAPMIRAGKIHAITCTGANLEEDVFNLVANSHYERIPNWRNLSEQDEADLHSKGFNRVTDTCIPEEEAIRHIEDKILKQWQSGPAFPHEHLMAILDDLEADIPRTDSWLIAARDAGIPVYVPGWEDSTLGNIFAAHCIKGDVEQSAVKSGIDYMMHLADWYMGAEHPIGFLQIGGGIAGDFPICVVPMLRQDMQEKAPLWGWFAQISESTTSYGGYSGAPPSEKITWGKLAPGTPMHMIESDATIVAPILFSYILN